MADIGRLKAMARERSEAGRRKLELGIRLRTSKRRGVMTAPAPTPIETRLSEPDATMEASRSRAM